MVNDPFNTPEFEDTIPASVCLPLEFLQEERHKFTTEFLDLQNPKSSSGRIMFVFVRRNLRAFHLGDAYKEAYVLNEAYLRGIKLIDAGEEIRNVSAWLRATCYNIIRELSRELQRSVPFEDHALPVEQYSVPPEELADDLRTVEAALKLLHPNDARLLDLKLVQGKSWKEIREILRLEGWEDLKEDVLRKRKERALIRLRKKFHALKPPDFKK